MATRFRGFLRKICVSRWPLWIVSESFRDSFLDVLLTTSWLGESSLPSLVGEAASMARC